jgi:hypothetical protein
MFSLLTLVLSPTGSFCTVIPVLRDWSLYNLLDSVIPHLKGCSCSRLGLWVQFLWALTMAMTTLTPQAARRLPAVHPDVAITLTVVTLCKPVLGSVSFDLCDCITKCCQFEDFCSSLIPC